MNRIKRIIRQEFPFLLSCPALLWQALFLYIPLFILVGRSFVMYSRTMDAYLFTASYYVQLFSSVYLSIIAHSFLLAVQTTLICLLIAYPTSYYLAFKVKKWRMLALLFLILPSWISLIIQIYAWMFLLKSEGVVSRLLYYVGLFAQPVHLLLLNTAHW